MGIYLKLFDTTAQYNAYTADTTNFILPNVSVAKDDPTTVHYNKLNSCESEIVSTTYEWVEIGGKKWATKNIGALTVTDYGQYFSWGGVNGYTADQVRNGCRAFSWVDYEFGDGTSDPGDYGMSKYSPNDYKKTLEAVDDAATVNMGTGWRMPTGSEYQALIASTTSAWTNDYQGSGVAGVVLTDATDSSKVLFFPATCTINGNIYYNDGRYWSSTVDSNIIVGPTDYAIYLGVNDENICNGCNNPRCNGYPIRGIYAG